ncbi:hypothetical protein [Ruminococcus albus]|uniref:Uncharacterized protein n=1 Tax=Ruminococcus albus TaxID=1264 RepID=A0A1I1I886_RUMAL|nr:hypothetical protein [Ruminococcus albus]SFC29430.1 hypothetical protein SAMN02910406_01465 [Ruminococcus albus]
MAEARVIITKITDDGTYPMCAEAELTDRFGKVHVFKDKLPIFAYDDTDDTCPREGVVRCFIKEENDSYYVIDTRYPDDVESEDGETWFEVKKEDVTPQLEKSSGMTLIRDESFEKVYKGYDESVIEYFIMKSDEPYEGEKSHRNAALFAMEMFNNLSVADDGYALSYAPDMMKCEAVSTEDFFGDPDFPQKNRYYRAFIDPPYGSHYNSEDFRRINSMLFPKGIQDTEIYSWSHDWSEYFDDGNEWWGCLYHTIYDRAVGRFVVIAASATD